MNLEWQQILTHLVGFLIAVWILRRFAWGPLLGLMEERRDKIAGEFKEIDKQKADASELTAEYEAKLKQIDNERREKLVEAVEEGKKMAADIKGDAMKETQRLHEKSKADLQRDVDKARVQLRDEMIAITMTATRKILHEETDQAKHRELIGKFIDGLEKV